MTSENFHMSSKDRAELESLKNSRFKLYFRFKDKGTRDDALKRVAKVKEFNDEFRRFTGSGPDTNPSHLDDALVLHFDRYDKNLLDKVKAFFQGEGLEVVRSDPYIITPEEQAKENEAIIQRRSELAQTELAQKSLDDARARKVVEISSHEAFSGNQNPPNPKNPPDSKVA